MKSERPTARRLRRALREGDVPFSPLIVRTAALLAAVALAPKLAHTVSSRFDERLHEALAPGIAPNPSQALADVAALATPILAVAALSAVLAGLLQTGGVVVIGGARRRTGAAGPPFFDGYRAMRSVVGATVAVLVLAVAMSTVRRIGPDLARAMPNAARTLELCGSTLSRLAVPAFTILVGACVIDFLLDRQSWLSRLRMTRAEVDEETRRQEGDPEVRRARRRAQEQMSRGDSSP